MLYMDQQTFSGKDHTVNIAGSGSHGFLSSLITPPQKCENSLTQLMNKWLCMCSNNTLFIKTDSRLNLIHCLDLLTRFILIN